MALKTENLAILLTDIAGFTEATANQSRVANEQLLATHNRLLLPIVKRFKGKHVKSIGDALLIVFRSPTDAMLCAMAMQDALFEYNRSTPPEEQIHIRVAASLGEVRVTRSDIFGEAVNTTSRIEGITPPDEIYFSEAVYMAMNKAEVPSREVGWKELKGISAPLRIFHIPRFSTPRLVPQDIMAAEDMTDLVYPYGGAHLTHARANNLSGFAGSGAAWMGRFVKPAVIGVVSLASVGVAAFYYQDHKPASTGAPAAIQAKVSPPVETKSEPPSAPKHPPSAASPSKAQPAQASVKPQAKEPPKKPTPSKSIAEPLQPLAYPTITLAKKAYKDKKLSKDEYDKAITAIKQNIRKETAPVKKDYQETKITKDEYRKRVEEIERKYK